jgi:hypothetical protein
MPQTATHGATRITPRAYLTYCQSQLDAAILDREELLNQLGLAHSQCRHWGANTAEAQAELEAEESAQLLDEALGVRRSGPLVEFDEDAIDEAETFAQYVVEDSAETLAESLGYGRTGSLVEFEGDVFDEVAAL